MVDFSFRDVHIQQKKQFGLDKNEIKFLHNNFSTIGPGNVEFEKKEFGYNINIYKNIWRWESRTRPGSFCSIILLPPFIINFMLSFVQYLYLIMLH